MIRYQIGSRSPTAHYFDLLIEIATPNLDGQVLRLPNWLPGSYLIRDFSRHLLDLQAQTHDRTLAIEQLDKSSWQLEPCDTAISVRYRVYAKDLSVRGAHLDHSHGYFNGSCVFLEVVGQGEQPCEVLIEKPDPEFAQSWQLATSLPRRTEAQQQPSQADDFGVHLAQDYDDLIDHPVEMGHFTRIGFEACGVPHEIILSGRFDCDEARLAQDLQRICEHHIRFFGEPAPMDYYQFQVRVVGEGYGGLEHRASTSLIARRDSLPQKGVAAVDDDYRDFLGLCSHEYFHTWNVKRIKPAAYQPYDLRHEVYTELLWAFEGITSYYDDLALIRCGLIEQSSYLELLAQTVTRVQRGLGRTRQTAAESSFNCWTKFYQQDENAANAIVSYYAKGCLIALCIDLKLRAVTQGAKSLDDVMRCLWLSYREEGGGVNDGDIERIVNQLADQDLNPFLHQLIHATSELPLVELLATVGVDAQPRAAAHSRDRGGKNITEDLPKVDFAAGLKDEVGGLKVLRLAESGSAQLAGLAAGDSIIAVDGLRLNLPQFEKKQLRANVGDRWRVHAFRRDELEVFEVELQAVAQTTYFLRPDNAKNEQRRVWLQQDARAAD